MSGKIAVRAEESFQSRQSLECCPVRPDATFAGIGVRGDASKKIIAEQRPLPLPASSTDIESQVLALTTLGFEDLRTRYRASFKRDAPRHLSRELLVRILAWEMQEKAFGGHDRETLKLLAAYARGRPEEGQLFRKLKPGTTVVREYQGTRHVVVIAEDGFVWQEKTYKSLSAIAREITGARWNGPRFFGVRAEDRAGKGRRV